MKKEDFIQYIFNRSLILQCNGTQIMEEFLCEGPRPEVVNLILKDNYLQKLDVDEVPYKNLSFLAMFVYNVIFLL